VTLLLLAAAALAGAGEPAPLPPLPSARQLAWHEVEFAAFLHFGINTFTDREWGDGKEDPSLFQPSALDCRQWARVCREAGMRGIILTAKHHDGFCLWPSKLTKHTVAASPWRGGKGDVVRELSEACREAGLALGLYLSPWDRNSPVYGSGARYNDLYVAQLEELLGGYGPLFEVWFDGACGEGSGGRKQTYDWPRFIGFVRRLQPGAVIFSDAGPDVRWVGNEKGFAGVTNWAGGRASATNVRGGEARFAAERVLGGGDGPPGCWATDDGVTAAAVTVELARPAAVDRVLAGERIELGQRVRAFAVEARVDGAWRTVAEGTTIGRKRIVRFPEVRAEAIRLAIKDARAGPTLARLSAWGPAR